MRSSEPLTFEQLWGVPAGIAIDEQPTVSEEKREAGDDYCPRKEIRCIAWDNGCQVETCILEIEDEGNG